MRNQLVFGMVFVSIWGFQTAVRGQTESPALPDWAGQERQEEGEPAENLSALDAAAAESVDPPTRSRWGQWNWRPRSWEWRQPAFLQRMSESTSRSWRNTRRSVGSWMSQTGTAIRESTSDTWETITRATTPQRSAQREQESRPRPPTGGRVNEFLSRPRVKF